MEIKDLYQFVLLLVLIGLILGVGVLTLNKFQATAGLNNETIAVLANVTDALKPIASDWMPLIVTIAVLAIILTLVITSFGAVGRR